MPFNNDLKLSLPFATGNITDTTTFEGFLPSITATSYGFGTAYNLIDDLSHIAIAILCGCSGPKNKPIFDFCAHPATGTLLKPNLLANHVSPECELS
ncbi:MAG: hypothetical protein FDX18_07020 [Chlorobium sp.]|nr:MAG: hypothetical protein FDX18_07020 [Chlorobium sp.]